MTHDEAAPRRSGAFMRMAERLGDLESPFYDEERQRDVWNEASAVGLQLAVWLGLVLASAMVWLGGEPMVPYALGLVGFVAAITIVTETYARRLGVSVDSCDARNLTLGRLLAFSAVVAVFSVGMARIWLSDFPPSGGFWPGFRSGAVIGAAIGSLTALGASAIAFVRNRADRAA